MNITFTPIQNSKNQGVNTLLAVYEDTLRRLRRDVFLNGTAMDVGLQRIWDSMGRFGRDHCALLGSDWLMIRLKKSRHHALQWASPGAFDKPFVMGLVSDGDVHWSAFFVIDGRYVLHADSVEGLHDSDAYLKDLLDLLRVRRGSARLVRLGRGTPQQPVGSCGCGLFALTAISSFCEIVSDVGDAETVILAFEALIPWLEGDTRVYPQISSILGPHFLTSGWFLGRVAADLRGQLLEELAPA